MAVLTTIEFEPTPNGIAEARDQLNRFAALFDKDESDAGDNAPEPTGPPAPSTADEAPHAVYRSATDGSRTRDLLKALPGDITQALTPTELGELVRPNDDDGSPLNSAQVRAVMRNEKRIERTLKRRGVIPEEREVLKLDDSRFPTEGCCRYYVSAADRAVLQTL